MKKIVTLVAIAATFFISNRSLAQGMSVNTTGSAADPHAILDVKSTTQGLLPPRFSSAQRATLASSLSSTQTGMMVADATSGALYMWNGSAWVASGASYTASSPLSISSNNIALNAGTSAGDLITWNGTNWVNSQPAVQHFSVTVGSMPPYTAINYAINTAGIFPSFSGGGGGGNTYLGEIEIFPYTFAPSGSVFCAGQLLAISSNAALFSLLGTNYGGNGTTTFALPNLAGRFPLGQDGSTYILGQQGGSSTITVTH